jgi:hypothetical protein
MIWMLSLALATSIPAGTDLYAVRAGDTVQSIASALGDPSLADELRTRNGLADGQQPTVGTLIEVPLQPTSVPQDAFVLTLRGTATVGVASAPPQSVQRFDPVRTGSTLCTGADSYATLRVATQCTASGEHTDDLTLAPDTCVVVLGAVSDGDRRSTAVRVQRGSIQVQPNEGGQGHVTVQAGDGQTTGSEGGYRVTVEDDDMRTEALYAAVAIQGAGAQVDLDAGQGSRVVPGSAPSPPVDLLPPGTPLRPGDGEALRRAVFTWTVAPEAFGYRFEVATGPDFVDLVFADDVPDPSYQPSLLLLPWPDDGVLFWRLATFDRFGFLGIPSEPRAMKLPSAPTR